MYAGDLTSDHIGRTVRIETKRGHVTSIVEDTLTGVMHATEREQVTTTLRFKNTTWTSGALLDVQDVGLTVGHTHPVEVA